MKRKSPTKRTGTNVPKGFDSWLEVDLHDQLKNCAYHVTQISYVQHKNYFPDFLYVDEATQRVYHIEAKGRFRDNAEARKYLDVREALKDNEEIVFVFQRPTTSMPGAKRRSDGTRYSMQEWADKHGFTWYTKDTIPVQWTRKK